MEWTPELDDQILRCRNGFWSCREIAELHDWGATRDEVRQRLTVLDNTLRNLYSVGYKAEEIAIQTSLPVGTVLNRLWSLRPLELPPESLPEEERTGWDGPIYEG